MGIFKRDSALENRLKKIREELSLINKDIRSLSDVAKNPEKVAHLPRLKSVEPRKTPESKADPEAPPRSAVHTTEPPSLAPKEADKQATQKAVLRDEKFRDYLSSSFESIKPLRQERRVQRNKAIIMMVFVLILLFWILYGLLV